MNQAALKQVIQSLRQDTQLLNQLNPLLRRQYVLLSTRQCAALEQLNQQASHLLAQLQQQAQCRSQALLQLGLTPTQAGFSQLLALLPPAVRQASQQLLDTVASQTAACQQQNQQNGELLASQRQLMQRLLGMDNNTSYPALPLR